MENESIKNLLNDVSKYIDDPTLGLPEEIFLFATQITPMVNVDLIVRNPEGKILLSWRDDEYCGTGWHVPGGIIRFKENAAHRIQEVAINELGCRVKHSQRPLEIKELIHNKKTRGHFITLVYECTFESNFSIEKQMRKENEIGYLAWHEYYPDNMIEVHQIYKNYFKER